MWASKPYCPVPEHLNIGELLLDQSVNMSARRGFWKTIFNTTDYTLKLLERKQWSPSREKALKTCEQWMIDHFEKSDGIGAIFPPIINSIIALRCLGYDNDHPLTASQIRELETLEIEEGDTLKVAPCFSPVWDTALAMNALVESGLPAEHPAVQKGAGWVLGKRGKRGRRLEDKESGGQARRMVLRIRKRVLSGRRRHFSGTHRAQQDPIGRPSARAIKARSDGPRA